MAFKVRLQTGESYTADTLRSAIEQARLDVDGVTCLYAHIYSGGELVKRVVYFAGYSVWLGGSYHGPVVENP